MPLPADVAHAWKALRRSPGSSLVIVVILALGMAAAVSVYSVVAGVVLRPLPFPEPDRLVQLRQVDPAEGFVFGASGPSFRDWEGSSTTLEALGAISPGGGAILGDGGETTRVRSARISGDLFGVLGVVPVVGRLIGPADVEAGAQPVAVLSEGLWRGRYGADPGILGRVVTLDGVSHEVVGVAPGEAGIGTRAEIWAPIPGDAGYMEVRHAHILTAVGRLAPDASPEVARDELNAILARVPGYDIEVLVDPLGDRLIEGFRAPLLILLGAVAFVLLVASANAGTLLLARTTRRRRELAIRTALGAGRSRVAAQLLAESTILALAAGAAGLAVSTWLIEGLLALAPTDLPRAGEIGVDGGVAAFALITALATGLLTGLIPLWRAARTAPAEDLHEADARSGTRSGARARSAFVVAEVALSVVLLVGAGLLVRSFLRIIDVDPGFRPDRVTAFEFSLPGYRYGDEARVAEHNRAFLDAVRALPGVETAALARNIPVGGSDMVTPALVEGREIENPPRVQIAAVSDAYFETIGTDVVSGRPFTAADVAGSPPVALVDEAFVDAYFDGRDPVGRRARTYFGPEMREIVGVVRSTVHHGLTETPAPKFYYPAAQMPAAGGWVLVRSDLPLAALAPAVRRAAAAVDEETPLGDVATMGQLLSRTTAQPRFYAIILSAFAALALLLALAGFFAVLSQSVAARRREIGVRMAVGARPAQVSRLVVGQGMRLTALGLALGLLGGLAGGRLLSGLLFGVGAADPVVLAGVVALLAAVAALAAWIPARRAAATDPVDALRAG